MTQPEPVEQPAASTDGRWPAWLVDAAIATIGAAALTAAMASAVGAAGALAAAAWTWWRSRPSTDNTPLYDVGHWLEQQFSADDRVAAALKPVLADIHAEGALVGTRSAEAVLDHVEAAGELPGPDDDVMASWDTWRPGNPEAARQILSADGKDVVWRRLLELDGVELSEIAANRVDEIAMVLADGLERGASIDEIATALTGVIADPRWAEMTAWTELNRAVSAASQAEYLGDGLTRNEWMNAKDQRVCPLCVANEAVGPVEIGDAFPSGDRRPPAHPRCRCGLLPVLDIDDLDVQKAAAGAGGWEAYWKRGRGRAKWVHSAHPWTALYRHLRGKVGDARAKRIAAQWHKDVLGIWPGEKRGKNPHGKG